MFFAARIARFMTPVLCALVSLATAAVPVPARAGETSDNSAPARLASFASDPAALAPIGVPDASTLQSGSFRFSYRYSIIHQDDLRDRSHRRSTDEVLTRFEEAPLRRDLQVHRFGLSYAPHDRVTLALVVPVLVTETDLVARDPMTASRNRYTADTEGVGDLELRALVPFMRNRNQTLQVEMGLTAPTGSTSKRGRDGQGRRIRLSYPHQLGSGTVDLLPGLVYRGFTDSLSWGVAGRARFRLYENTKGYNQGDNIAVSGWLAHSWTDWMSTSVRSSWEAWEQISGVARPSCATATSCPNPELDPKRYGGQLIELGPGVNFKLPFDRAPRFGVEMAWPLWQELEGPQLERDWRLTAGFTWDF